MHAKQTARLIWTLRLRPPLVSTREPPALRTRGSRIHQLMTNRPCPRRHLVHRTRRRASRPRRRTSNRCGSRSLEWSSACSRARTSSLSTSSVPRLRGHGSRRSASRSRLRPVHEIEVDESPCFLTSICMSALPPHSLSLHCHSVSSSALAYVASPSRISVAICTSTESDLAIPAIIHSHPLPIIFMSTQCPR